ncbi:hypothetical protein [Arthrobacter sp. ISL-69]|uniref:hypothetical protein n=1 Tax=Arthrobacter sp. ISL-69 TaxID=2819113 RepID=UPI001BEB78B7|nr:hypothetical protein [Arthrobacter sp. ISL-69]MBT2538908.1 hypothetical protein [Arthrobacter sp. ISL-69]
MKPLLKNPSVIRALMWTEAMIAVTVVHHVYRLGMEVLIASAILLVLPVLLMWWYRRRPSPATRWVYAVNAGLVFVYFGIIDGFLDHVLKALGLQNTTFLPGSDADIVKTVYHLWSPEAGHLFYESTGILTFVVGLGAIYFSYSFLRTTGTNSSPAKRISSEAASL